MMSVENTTMRMTPEVTGKKIKDVAKDSQDISLLLSTYTKKAEWDLVLYGGVVAWIPDEALDIQ